MHHALVFANQRVPRSHTSGGHAHQYFAMPSPRAAGAASAWPWAALMRRVFALDILRCPRCGGRRSLVTSGVSPGPRPPKPARDWLVVKAR